MEWFNESEYLNTYIIPWSFNIFLALLIFVVGRWLAKLAIRALRAILTKSKVDETLTEFLGNILYVALIGVVVIAALNKLGVDTTSVLAVFAAAGLAIGLALKDSLSNFAAGVMLILFKPFKSGDFVEAAGVSGTVERIAIFNTIFRTGDNKEITIPNGGIYGGNIINFSALETRRIDLVIGIGYDDDIQQAKQVIERVIDSNSRILPEPAPVIMLLELADSCINFAVRPWVQTSDYWGVRAELLEQIKKEFEANEISIPFPQRDIHILSDSVKQVQSAMK